MIKIALIGFTLRLAATLLQNGPYGDFADTHSYNEMARWFVSGVGELSITHAPLYPLFLALLGKAAIVMQCAIGTLSAILAYRIAGQYAAWIVAVDPFLVSYSSFYLTETLFTTMLMGCVYLCWRQEDNMFAIGLFFGLTALCRSITVPLIPFMALYACNWRPQQALLCIAAAFIPPLIYSAYVFDVRHQSVFIEIHKGRQLYEGLNPDDGTKAGIEKWIVAMNRIPIKDPIEKDNYFFHQACQMIKVFPLDYAVKIGRHFMKFWRVTPYAEFHGLTKIIISQLFMVPLLLLFFLGIMSGNQIPIVILILGYSLASSLFATQIRYRVPLDPLIAIVGCSLNRRAVHTTIDDTGKQP